MSFNFEKMRLMNGFQHNVLSQHIKFSTTFRIFHAVIIKIAIFDKRKGTLRIWPVASKKFIFGTFIHIYNYARAADSKSS